METWRRHECLKHGGGKNGEQIGAEKRRKDPDERGGEEKKVRKERKEG